MFLQVFAKSRTKSWTGHRLRNTEFFSSRNRRHESLEDRQLLAGDLVANIDEGGTPALTAGEDERAVKMFDRREPHRMSCLTRCLLHHVARWTTKSPSVILLFAMAVSSIWGTQPTYASEFIPLAFFPDANHSGAFVVSDDGAVVGGFSGHEIEGGGGSFSYIQAFRWTDRAGMERLESPINSLESYSYGISGDGSTIVGNSSPDFYLSNSQAFTWNESDGMNLLAPAQSHAYATSAYATSFDGSVVVGSFRVHRGFRWTKDDGLEDLGEWNAYDVSADGAVIVGVRRTGQLVRWNAETGEVEIGVDFVPSVPRVSLDGSVIVGSESDRANDSVEAVRWTEGTGVTRLGQLGTDYSAATGTNHDGSIIIGNTRRHEGEIVNHWSRIRGFAWTEHLGMKPIEQVLVEYHGLDLNGYTLNGPHDISPNGRFIVGGGVNPNGDEEAWLIRLDSPLGTPVPEPSALGLVCAGAVGIGLIRRRRRADVS